MGPGKIHQEVAWGKPPLIEVVVLKGPREQAQGLIGMKPIPAGTFFVFPKIQPNTYFHSQGVLEPFDIAFIDRNGNPLLVRTVIPPKGLIKAPPGTDTVIETKAGTLTKIAGLGDAAICFPSSDVGLIFPVLLVAVGVGLGAVGFRTKNSHWGAVAVGAGGSMAAAGIVIFIQKLFFASPPKS